MTQGQRESIYLIYVNVCNALVYAEDLCMEDSASPNLKSAVRTIRDRLRWIKTNMDLKVQTDVSKTVDTLRHDGLMRMLSNMPEELQEQLEETIVSFLNSKTIQDFLNKK